MPIDFHFIPLPPEAISGDEVLSQTEQAINELGAMIDSGVGDAGAKAQEAIDNSNSANATANSALQQVQSAQSTADNALLAAQGAQETAQQAQLSADSAQQDADQAFANSATANTTALNAESIATQALTAANEASGVFQVDATFRDANEAFLAPEKSFLTNASTTAPNLNFPADIGIPCWFMVYTSSDNSTVTHTCWDDVDTSRIYTRTATINNSDPQNPVVTWSPWQSVATPNNLESVEVQVDPAGQPSGTYLVFVYTTTTGQETLYVNLTQAIGGGYSSGNGAIDISADNRISLLLDPSGTGASVSPSGLKVNAGHDIGDIELKSFRNDELPFGWHFCNGDLYTLTSTVGTALNAFSDNFKTDWGIVVSGDNISIPNLFYKDGRGFFLRAVDGMEQSVGSMADDVMRAVTGNLFTRTLGISGASIILTSNGAFISTAQSGSVSTSVQSVSASGNETRTQFNSSFLGPNYSGIETAPLYRGMTPAIYLGV